MRKIFPRCLRVTFLYFIVNASAANGAEYGEPCSDIDPCDTGQFVKCSSSGRCTCLESAVMAFEENEGDCAVLAGHKCGQDSFDDNQDVPSWLEYAPCISNAACIDDLCKCSEASYQNTNGTCVWKHTHGQDCLMDDMCDESLHLECAANKTCRCKHDRLYSHSLGRCAVRAGESCRSIYDCPIFSNCLLGTCVCSVGYFQNEQGSCKEQKNLGGSCVNGSHCKSKVDYGHPLFDSYIVSSLMVCLNGKCQCDPLIANEELREMDGKRVCSKRLNVSCTPTSGDRDICISGAGCDPETETCQCSIFYFQAKNDTCEPLRMYGQPCSEATPCNYVTRWLNCSATTKTCGCEEDTFFYSYAKMCRGTLGPPCRFHGEYRPCVSSASCSRISNKCECGSDRVPSKVWKNYCYLKEGSTPCYGDARNISRMSFDATCLPGLLCSNRTCACPYKDFQTFDVLREKCVSKLGGPCNDSGDCKVTYSVCDREVDGSGPLQCRCKRGYIEVAGKCQIAYGGACTQRGYDLCDSAAPLECSSKGICESVRQQLYDRQQEVCRGLVGAKCDLRWGNSTEYASSGFCVEGATCKRFRGMSGPFGFCKCERGRMLQLNGTGQ